MENEKIKDKQLSVLLSFLVLLLCIIVLAGIALFIYGFCCMSGWHWLGHFFTFSVYYALLGLCGGLVVGLIILTLNKTGKKREKAQKSAKSYHNHNKSGGGYGK
jgi:hypothetical protein